MYNSFMNGYSPGYGTGYNQNNYGNYGMMQSQIPAQSIDGGATVVPSSINK